MCYVFNFWEFFVVKDIIDAVKKYMHPVICQYNLSLLIYRTIAVLTLQLCFKILITGTYVNQWLHSMLTRLQSRWQLMFLLQSDPLCGQSFWMLWRCVDLLELFSPADFRCWSSVMPSGTTASHLCLTYITDCTPCLVRPCIVIWWLVLTTWKE
jgi:hypothetical protein